MTQTATAPNAEACCTPSGAAKPGFGKFIIGLVVGLVAGLFLGATVPDLLKASAATTAPPGQHRTPVTTPSTNATPAPAPVTPPPPGAVDPSKPKLPENPVPAPH